MDFSLTADDWKKYQSLVLVGGIAIGLLGPFGQVDRFLPVERIGLWVAYLMLGLPLLYFTRRIVDRALSTPPWIVSVLLTTAIACLPILFWVEALGLIQGRGLPSSLWDWTYSAGEVWLIAFSIVAGIEVCSQLSEKSGGHSVEKLEISAKTAPIAGFADGYAGAIYAFCAEGHYTRIYSQSGNLFIHQSFSNVLHASKDLDGVQVHRSWWVAKAAVIDFRRSGSAGEISLINGVRVPVARRRMHDEAVLALRSQYAERDIRSEL